MIRDVVAVVGDRVATFELGIVCQVFRPGSCRRRAARPHLRGLRAARPGAIPTTSGFSVQVEHGLDRIAGADLVAVPAWPQLDAPVPEPLLAALREAAGRGARVLTVCTGAFLPAAAGLLDGRCATTHWQFAGLLSRRHPRVRVDPNILYVEDGPVLSSAGAAAGIDACLHLIRLEYGAATANALARRLVVPAHRSGGQAQYVEAPMPAATHTVRAVGAARLDS
ncbi:DJ-1/PfpI family protein [Nonomuraea dietziae]|uniref:DJ-1/PfpI family protein n=1 Tax=Nonomuraea dietziae TaxID=65515 RepID=UPI0031E0A3A2